MICFSPENIKKTQCSTQGRATDVLRACYGLACRGTMVVLAFLFTLVVASCTKTNSPAADNQYAQGFFIEEQQDGVELVIFDSQKKNAVQTRLFIPNDRPFTKIATTSSTHVGFLTALGAQDLIAGVCDPQYIYNDAPNAQDLGSNMTLNPERVIACGAEILVFSYTTDDKLPDMLQKLGVKCIYCNEWTEQHPLARAEWIRVFGALTGHLHEADSIFNEVRLAYLAECDSANLLSESDKISIMSGNCWQGTWYVPSGNTYMGRLFRDADFSYAYAADSTGASIPLSFEQALLSFKDADVWVGAPSTTLRELKSLDEKHTWFKSYETGRVYHFNRRMNGPSANDFWETGVVHPDLILHDLRLIRSNAPDSLLFFSGRLQ